MGSHAGGMCVLIEMRCLAVIEFSRANTAASGLMEPVARPPTIVTAPYRRRAQCSKNRQMGCGVDDEPYEF